MNVLGRYIHGSKDSTDLDVCYWVDELPSTIQECKEWCEKKNGENVNLFTVKENIDGGNIISHIDKVYKGSPDELNNSLLHTYYLHTQDNQLPMGLKYVHRDSMIKYIRSIRIILSHLSRSRYRDTIKHALTYGGWNERLVTLKSIPVGTIDFTTLNHSMSAEDIKKVISFQIGQSLGLMDHKEYYTKSEIAEAYPILRQFLYRDPNSDQNELEGMICYFVNRLMDEVNKNIIYMNDYKITFINGKYDIKEEKKIW